MNYQATHTRISAIERLKQQLAARPTLLQEGTVCKTLFTLLEKKQDFNKQTSLGKELTKGLLGELPSQMLFAINPRILFLKGYFSNRCLNKKKYK